MKTGDTLNWFIGWLTAQSNRGSSQRLFGWMSHTMRIIFSLTYFASDVVETILLAVHLMVFHCQEQVPLNLSRTTWWIDWGYVCLSCRRVILRTYLLYHSKWQTVNNKNAPVVHSYCCYPFSRWYWEGKNWAYISTGYEALNSALFSARLLQNLQLVLFLQYEKTTQK